MPVQSHLATHRKGLCLLCLDAGGPRGISQLKILAEMMRRMDFEASDDEMKRPCDVFDMIGGVGSGGFIAILLVFFELTAEEALAEFIDLSINVLYKHAPNAQARTTALRDYIYNLLLKYQVDQNMRLMDPISTAKACKLVCPVSYKRQVGSICILRNYLVRREQALDLTISEALLITLATPPLFTSMSVFKDAATFEYIGADWTLTNPTQEIIVEAHDSFGAHERVACLLNLGCGRPGIFAAPEDSSSAEWNQFLERLATDGEREAQSLESQMGSLGLYHRFSVSTGLERSAKLGPGDIVTHTVVYLADVAVSRKMNTCIDSLKIRDGVSSLDQLKHSGGRIMLSPQLPPLTRTFVMRKEPWDFIDKILLGPTNHDDAEGPRMLVVTGMGGCGKTQLMLKFMKVHEAEFACRFFIDGSSRDRIRADIIQNVRAMANEYSQKGFEECLLLLSLPSRNGPRLLLYDNVDDPHLDLVSLLPRGGSCAVVITSRNEILGDLYPDAHLQLNAMSMDEAVELLLYNPNNSTPITDQTRETTTAIAQALGCLPIALQQARSYMLQTRCSASGYLERLSSNQSKLLGQEIKHQANMRAISTYAAFEASFERLTVHSQKFLWLLCHFHWHNIPLELVILAAKHQFSKYESPYVGNGDDFDIGKKLLEDIFLREGEWDLTTLDDMTVSLQNYSLTTFVLGVDTALLQIHPLVQEWVMSCIPEDNRPVYQSAAILLLALGVRTDHTAALQYLPSHVTHMCALWDNMHVNNAAAFGHILRSNGFYQGALKLWEIVVGKLRVCLDANDIGLSESIWNLSFVYRDLGRLDEARTLQEEVNRMRKETLGDRDPRTILSSSTLAHIYQNLGWLKEAAVLQAEVLKLDREILGERHPSTINALSNLSSIYQNLGRLDEAAIAREEVLKLRKEIHGERDPRTIAASGNLATIYLALGRLKEAETLQVEVLKLMKEVLGERHPYTIGGSNNLASIYQALGRLDEARILQEEVLKIRTESVGQRHPSTITVSNNLANTYRDMGQPREALERQEEALTMMKEILGERHPHVVGISSDLAITFHRLGRLDEAHRVAVEALGLQTEIFGPRHPDTLVTSNNLAAIYRDLGRLNDAQVLQLETLDKMQEIMGKKHHKTTSAMLLLVEIYLSLHQRIPALNLLRAAEAIISETLGAAHPQYLKCQKTKADAYYFPWGALWTTLARFNHIEPAVIFHILLVFLSVSFAGVAYFVYT